MESATTRRERYIAEQTSALGASGAIMAITVLFAVLL
jgi:hypothetical protein